MLMTGFTLDIISGIELPAMYKVNTFNLTDSTCNYFDKLPFIATIVKHI